MKKEFIPYLESLALRELGFDEPCICGYSKSTEQLETYSRFLVTRDSFTVDAPTFSQAFRWFREKYGCCHFINPSGKGYCSGWEDLGNNEHGFENYSTYEEAELACLSKLIEIVKNK